MNVLGLSITVAPMNARQKWTRRLLVIAAANVAVLSSGVAYAFWTATGTGTGAAKAGSITFSVSAVGATAPTVLLHPGSTAGGSGQNVGGDLVVTLKNNSGFPVAVKQVSSSGTITASGATGAASCNSQGTGVSVPTVDVSSQNLTVPSDDADHDIRIQNVVSMSSSSDTNCQNQTFSIPVTVTVQS